VAAPAWTTSEGVGQWRSCGLFVAREKEGLEKQVINQNGNGPEMSVATPKHQAREPIDLDIILVCRKRPVISAESGIGDHWWDEAITVAEHQVERFKRHGRWLGRNDVRVVVTAQVLRLLSNLPANDPAAKLAACADDIEAAIARLAG